MNAPDTTARMRREARRVELSRLLVRLLAKHDITQVALAQATGARPKIVQQWTDRERPETPSLADLAGIADASRELARDLLAWAAEPLGLLVVERRRTAESAADWLGALGAITDGAHGVTRALVDALSPSSDGGTQLTDRELDELEQRASAAEVALAELRERIAAERARRGIGEPRGLRCVR